MQEEMPSALRGLLSPLHFLARHDFATLDRVRDLEPTLQRATQILLQQHPRALVQEIAPQILGLLETGDVSREQRLQRLRSVYALAQRLEQTWNQPDEIKLVSPAIPVRAVAAPPKPQPKPPARPAPVAPKEVPVDSPLLSLTAPIQYIKGVGPRFAALLIERGIRTVTELLYFLPRRYQGRVAEYDMRSLKVGSIVSIEAPVLRVTPSMLKGRRSLEVLVGDAQGVFALLWFRIPGSGFAERFQPGVMVRASGQVRRFRTRMQMIHPEVTFPSQSAAGADDEGLDDAVVPLYSEIDGIRPAQLRRIIHTALPAAQQLSDPLPLTLREGRNFPALSEAITVLHHPPKDLLVEDLDQLRTPWQQRLIYEELLFMQLAVLRRRAQTMAQPGKAVALDQTLDSLAQQLLPFSLTGAQRRVLGEIEKDMRSATPMNRLVQGDVGSGKTAVALTAVAGAAKAGLQAVIMAPTELLAEQHARNAQRTLGPVNIRMALLTSRVTSAERRRILAELADGSLQVVVGTHALIADAVRFHRLGLAIVDEQHRFGVLQRARLLELGRASLGATPHMLLMTATPIPRTLALTVYGDLDVSIIDELPPGRTPIKTFLYRSKQREQVYQRVQQAVHAGRQAYVVFPLVEESDKEGMDKLLDATSSALELSQGPLAGLAVGLLHGRMTYEEKDAVMQAFARGEVQVLVSTTVIEVGIDVPNATVMVIEHAERFGLSQLHQLRGRVGRGQHKSECLLVAHTMGSEDAWRRLKIMEQSNDGFRIAEEDLAIRGPGDFVGTRQAGLPLLQLANLARDQVLLQAARDDATALLAIDPTLAAPEHQGLRLALERTWEARLELAQIG